MCFIFILSLICICIGTCVSQREINYCAKDDITCSNKNVDSGLYNPFLSKIREGINNHEECMSTNCSCFIKTIKCDLLPFKNGITKEHIESIRKKGTTYVVFNNKLFRDKDCMFPARCEGVQYFILQLINKLDNMEIILNTRDWPQVSRHFQDFGPVFSFSKTSDYYDIMFPAWAFWKGGPAISLYPTGIGRWDQHLISVNEQNKTWPWDKKLDKGFFRGSRTSQERDVLILTSRKFPDLIDAQYTKNQAWKSSADTLGAEPAKEISFKDHCQYKYLFNFRGVAASFRFKHLFLCGSLVIHFGDEWIEFFYPLLKPWVHYIPMDPKSTESDLIRLINFLKSNDELVQEIANRGRQVIVQQLTMKNIKCYWRNLLKRYGRLLKYKIELNSNLIEIK